MVSMKIRLASSRATLTGFAKASLASGSPQLTLHSYCQGLRQFPSFLIKYSPSCGHNLCQMQDTGL